MGQIKTTYVSDSIIQFRPALSRFSNSGTKYSNIYMTVIHSRVQEDLKRLRASKNFEIGARNRGVDEDNRRSADPPEKKNVFT